MIRSIKIEVHSAVPALRNAKSLEVLSANDRSSGSSVVTIPTNKTLAAIATSILTELDRSMLNRLDTTVSDSALVIWACQVANQRTVHLAIYPKSCADASYPS
jgi:hypothetical protein